MYTLFNESLASFDIELNECSNDYESINISSVRMHNCTKR